MLHRFATWIGRVLPSSALLGKGRVDHVLDRLTDQIPITDKAGYVLIERQRRAGWRCDSCPCLPAYLLSWHVAGHRSIGKASAELIWAADFNGPVSGIRSAR
jgi:hypothetical protein